MSVWREVQEILYRRWADAWAETTRFYFDDETAEQDSAPWCIVTVQSRPSIQGSIGQKGSRRFDRRAVVFIRVRSMPDTGVGMRSDLAAQAKDIFEGCRFGPHDIRFAACDIGDDVEIEGGRWRQVLVECPFDFEEIR